MNIILLLSIIFAIVMSCTMTWFFTREYYKLKCEEFSRELDSMQRAMLNFCGHHILGIINDKTNDLSERLGALEETKEYNRKKPEIHVIGSFRKGDKSVFRITISSNWGDNQITIELKYLSDIQQIAIDVINNETKKTFSIYQRSEAISHAKEEINQWLATQFSKEKLNG